MNDSKNMLEIFCGFEVISLQHFRLCKFKCSIKKGLHCMESLDLDRFYEDLHCQNHQATTRDKIATEEKVEWSKI